MKTVYYDIRDFKWDVDSKTFYADGWDLFDALTCDHPMLADIPEYILSPYSEGDKKKWVTGLTGKDTSDNVGQ